MPLFFAVVEVTYPLLLWRICVQGEGIASEKSQAPDLRSNLLRNALLQWQEQYCRHLVYETIKHPKKIKFQSGNQKRFQMLSQYVSIPQGKNIQQ